MTKRAAKKYAQDEHQWYREPAFTIEQVFDHLDFPSRWIWDASCGGGNILDVAKGRGFRVVGSDIVDRPTRSPSIPFIQRDFLALREKPFRVSPGDGVSLFCNPPYGRVGDVANMGERFVMHALRYFGDQLDRMAFVLPIEFMAGQDRYHDIYANNRPSHSLICCQRPSMPPGAMVEELGDKAYRGGMADYCVLVWTKGGPWRCETIWMRPTDASRPEFVEKRRK